MSTGQFRIRRMQDDESDAVRSLILEGLREHWGTIDTALNRDLDSLVAADDDRIVLVAIDGPDVVGTGTIVDVALVPFADPVAPSPKTVA